MKHVIAVLLFALAGCATTANYEKSLSAWIGADQAKLVATWGTPISTSPAPNGGQVLEFDRATTAYVPGHTYNQAHANYANGNVSAGSAGVDYSPITTSGHTVTEVCKTRFTLDNAGHVVSYSWEGESCRA
jgi:hypothetical protein